MSSESNSEDEILEQLSSNINNPSLRLPEKDMK